MTEDAPREPVDRDADLMRIRFGGDSRMPMQHRANQLMHAAGQARDERDVLLTEIRALREALANARSYIPRGPSVDAADLLADIDALLMGIGVGAALRIRAERRTAPAREIRTLTAEALAQPADAWYPTTAVEMRTKVWEQRISEVFAAWQQDTGVHLDQEQYEIAHDALRYGYTVGADDWSL